MARAQLVRLLCGDQQGLPDQSLPDGPIRGVELRPIPGLKHGTKGHPGAGVRPAKPLQLLQGNRHWFFNEDVDAALHAVAGNGGLQEEERGHHGDMRLLSVQHPPVILIEGDQGFLQPVQEEIPRVFVSRAGRNPHEAQLRQPVADLEGKVDVTARANDDRFHGVPHSRWRGWAACAGEERRRPAFFGRESLCCRRSPFRPDPELDNEPLQLLGHPG